LRVRCGIYAIIQLALKAFSRICPYLSIPLN